MILTLTERKIKNQNPDFIFKPWLKIRRGKRALGSTKDYKGFIKAFMILSFNTINPENDCC